MNTFKKKSLIAALAGASALTAAGAAQAVAISPEGVGEVLIYPYYTVRAKLDVAPFNSLVSVVNSTASAMAVKVRFIEGKASREVLDFNLFLSAKDVWTAAVVPTADGAGIVTTDKSCTIPAIPAIGVPFVNFAYDGDPVEDNSLDRTREGYVEIIQMGWIDDNTATWSAVTHSKGTANVPTCKFPSDISGDIAGNFGGLFGGITLINVLAGEDYSVDAVAIEGFRPGDNLYFPPGSTLPDLGLADGFSQNLYNDVGFIDIAYGYWSNPIDAVSAVMMRNNVMNEFVLDAGTKSGTDWVVTMPTKRYYYEDDGTLTYLALAGDPAQPTNRLFQKNLGTSGACDDVRVTQYDREERTVSSPVSFSPPPPEGRDSLCWEANVITFNNSKVLASKNIRNIATLFENGWANLSFNDASLNLSAGVHVLYDDFGLTYAGLPVIGFAAQSFNNGLLSDAVTGKLIQSQYGGSFIHKYTTNITGFAP